MITAIIMIGYPALLIADKALGTNILPVNLNVSEPPFWGFYGVALWVGFYMDSLLRGRGKAELDEDDRIRLRNITVAYNEVAQRTNEQTTQLARQHRIDGELRQAAANVIASFDAWTATVPELPSTRHAFERALVRLKQEVSRKH